MTGHLMTSFLKSLSETHLGKGKKNEVGVTHGVTDFRFSEERDEGTKSTKTREVNLVETDRLKSDKFYRFLFIYLL